MTRPRSATAAPVRVDNTGEEPVGGVAKTGRRRRGVGGAAVGARTDGEGGSQGQSPESKGRSPEAYLHKATQALSPTARAKYATRGLAQPGLDDTTQAMLLRQLYLAHMEARRFERALQVSEQMIALQVLPDVARQDAARACLGLENSEQAVVHLRIAGRVAPASRRAFHAWTLGSTLYFAGRANEAVGVLERAVRWATNAKPLYAAQLALAHLAAGDALAPDGETAQDHLRELRDALRDAPCGQGYGQFVLGELAFQLGEQQEARRCLEGFIRRTNAGRVSLAVGLKAELQRAEGLLEQLVAPAISS